MQSEKWQNDLCSFQGKPFNIRVIQAYAPTSNAEEAEFERFYEELQDLLELRPKMQYLDAVSKMTKWSLFVSKANHSISW